MMKAVFFCAVMLSLLTVGWTAPMVCDKLLKPAEKEVDFRGTWYVISVSTESCWLALLFNLLFGLSGSLDITPKGSFFSPANTYDANVKIKLYGLCHQSTETVYKLSNNALSSSSAKDSVDAPLHTDCPDCVVMKGEGSITLLSRRTVVTAAEMMEFEKQAECLGWSNVQVFNIDHDTENCRTPDQELSENEIKEMALSFGKRLCDMFLDFLSCYFKLDIPRCLVC